MEQLSNVVFKLTTQMYEIMQRNGYSHEYMFLSILGGIILTYFVYNIMLYERNIGQQENIPFEVILNMLSEQLIFVLPFTNRQEEVTQYHKYNRFCVSSKNIYRTH